jgi:polysaccharide pyruvyl transferase WcaK-like protein
MKILLDQAVYDQRNKGNVALLQAAINRLKDLWPHAEIYVLTEAPYSLKLYCPNVHPVGVFPWQDYSAQTRKFDLLGRAFPRFIMRWLLEFREEVWHRYPNLSAGGGPWNPNTKSVGYNSPESDSLSGIVIAEPKVGAGSDIQVSDDVVKAIQDADIVITTGGGYLCDADKHYTAQVFRTLEMAVQLGKPTFMVGQGVGPLQDPDLRARLKKVLPCIDLILIREPKVALPLLESLDVNQDKVLMTGDDAVEMAYRSRSTKWGNSLGVNLRIARYTEVNQAFINRIRSVLHECARKKDASLLALPTSSGVAESDLEYIRQILDGYKNVKTDWRRYEQPMDLIHKIAKCRVVVTGSYHPAVFALSQGIPAIGLVKSKAYVDKFSALQDEFGSALTLIHLDDKNLDDKLGEAIESAWVAAREVREPLVAAAARLSRMAQNGYEHIYELTQSRLNKGS